LFSSQKQGEYRSVYGQFRRKYVLHANHTSLFTVHCDIPKERVHQFMKDQSAPQSTLTTRSNLPWYLSKSSRFRVASVKPMPASSANFSSHFPAICAGVGSTTCTGGGAGGGAGGASCITTSDIPVGPISANALATRSTRPL